MPGAKLCGCYRCPVHSKYIDNACYEVNLHESIKYHVIGTLVDREMFLFDMWLSIINMNPVIARQHN